MSTHDYVLANQVGSDARVDLNLLFQAIVSQNSSATEPATTYAYMFWFDTSVGYLKQRNSANTAWEGVSVAPATAATHAPQSGQLIRHNYLYNGRWLVDQELEGSAAYGVSTAAKQTIDGFICTASGGGAYSVRRVADPDNAALMCCKIACTTADVSLAAADYYRLGWHLGGGGVANLMSGTPNAKNVTVKFKFKTNVLGVYGISLKNGNADRYYAAIFTATTTSEEEHTITMPLDTSGTWSYSDNDIGLTLRLTLAAGTDSQGTLNTWSASNISTSAAQCNFMSSTANTLYLKVVQMVEGTVAGDPMPQTFQEALIACQYDYQKSFPVGTPVAQNAGTNGSTRLIVNKAGAVANKFQDIVLQTPMRKAYAAGVPSGVATTYNPSAANAEARNLVTNADCSGTSVAAFTDSRLQINLTADAGSTVGDHTVVHWTVNQRL